MRRPSAKLVLGATAILVVASAGLAASWAMVGGASPSVLDRAHARAIDAARTIAVDINSYDYRSIDTQFGVVRAEITGSLLENFDRTRAAVRDGFVNAKISSTASIAAAGLVSGTKHEGTVVVWLSVTTTTDGKPSVQQAPLRVHLVERDAKWLADQIATVG